ncbi:hypothetical protein F2Q69_00044288 [Brassica cretica]|uniref:Uncharacterized protein n=1 Tax=Brassica cretica TaxID=69181 RepID=A0A8S9N8T8_BRACR|nr:hypothetical protein F2Q69_00044288 [Brassica cretica]
MSLFSCSVCRRFSRENRPLRWKGDTFTTLEFPDLLKVKELKRIGLIKKAAANGTRGSSQEAVAAHGWRVGATMAMNVAVAVLFARSSQAARAQASNENLPHNIIKQLAKEPNYRRVLTNYLHVASRL